MGLNELTVVDLFCGAGGLSNGLGQAGFKVVAGVENNELFARTYQINHPRAGVLIKDIREVTGEDIKKASGVKHINLLAGCPPCQGFSQLTAKHKHEDPRNQLPLEMARLAEELRPDMIMMENVPGIASKGKDILDKFVSKLESLGYDITYGVLQLADYGVPQTRRRFVLLAGNGFRIDLPKKTHSRVGKEDLKPWKTLKDALITTKSAPVTLSEALETGGPTSYNWHVTRDLSPKTLARLRATKEGDGRQKLPKNLRPACHKNSNKGFSNVYGRLSWKQTPGTMTSGCTTLSMGRFGHPTEDRTLSVREAADIQTFPKSYKFETEHMANACIMVGNAFPPHSAKMLGAHCIEVFRTQ